MDKTTCVWCGEELKFELGEVGFTWMVSFTSSVQMERMIIAPCLSA